MQFNNKSQRTRLMQSAAFLMLTILAGCNKLVEIDPPISSIPASEVFKSKEQANSVLAGMYSMMGHNTGIMVFSNGGITCNAGMSAGELVNTLGALNLPSYQFYSNKLERDNFFIQTQMWAPAYKIIFVANTVTAHLGDAGSLIDDSTKRVLTGEAKFIRAFCYFYLTNMFGDVPLVLTTDFNQSTKMVRTPQAEVYQQIEKDLEEAKASLPKDYSMAAGERVRVNKWAATALLARVYLYNKKWAEAEEQATEVITNNQYKLATLNSAFANNGTEAIFQLKNSMDKDPVNATWDGVNFLPIMRYTEQDPADQQAFLDPAAFELIGINFTANYHLTPQCINAFELGDKRRREWTDSCPTPNVSPWNGIPFYYAFKYKIYSRLPNQPEQYYTVLRLAEQYLIRAEAKAQQKNDLAGAAADINKLRTRAGLANTTATTSDELLDAVMHERQVELFAEWGHRWFDLKRTDKANAVLGAMPDKQPWSPTQLLYPIPPDEILNNPRITQNFGY